ncbi:hypothetical protein QJQ45_020008 [Haematococcus lacustris]|nr:hypothetical protein QJQ45_020008 [Haematococcus lacustris]
MVLLERPWEVWGAFAATWFSNIVCVFLICQHIRNYTQPGFQRYICRIVFIVPFYCTGSWLALKYRDYSIYFETPRDCYEAWVIYNFMSLCMAYVGGPGAVVVKSDGKVIAPSWVLCTCCMAPIPVDGFFLRKCKQGTLQFVIAKPFLAFFTLALFVVGKYQVGDWSFTNGYFYLAIIYNVCYSVALFWMLLFYVGTDELLKPYKPLLKFFVFKTVIFLTFWQGLLVTFMATRFGWTPDDSEALQNWLICIEMFFAAIGMFFAFPVSEYKLGGGATPGWSIKALAHAISISDVMEDIIIQFNPGYKSYVLHTDGGPSENVKRKKFRGKSKKRPAFSMLAHEIGAVAEKMKRLKPKDKKRLLGLTRPSAGGDEEGGHWHAAVHKQNLVMDGIEVIGGTAQKMVKWLPGISEVERRQAELLDSDSDAEYDEENQKDNQLDDRVLTSSSSGHEQSFRQGLRPGTHGRGGRGHGLRHGRLASGSSSEEEEDGNETEAPSQQRMGGRVPDTMTSDSEGPGNYRTQRNHGHHGHATSADWAQFAEAFGSTPRLLPVAELVPDMSAGDDSWAQFPNPEAKATSPGILTAVPREEHAAPGSHVASPRQGSCSGGGEELPSPRQPALPPIHDAGSSPAQEAQQLPCTATAAAQREQGSHGEASGGDEAGAPCPAAPDQQQAAQQGSLPDNSKKQ